MKKNEIRACLCIKPSKNWQIASLIFDLLASERGRCYTASRNHFGKEGLFVNTIKISKGGVKMIAHRGLSGLERENTCSAFVAACNRESYFGVETDVHRTADGHYVIFHDDDTRRVGVDSLKIEESTFDTLRSLQLTDIDGQRGRSDLRIPSLEEYIGICKKYDKDCVLELKNHFRAADIHRIVSIVEKSGWLERVIFISFDLKNLIALRRYCPQQRAQYLLSKFQDDALDALSEYDLGLDIKYTALTPEIVSRVHDIGKEVNCWTVNEPDEAAKLVDMGVDYITTNILE